MEEIIADNAFDTFLVRGSSGKKNGHGTRYIKDKIELVQMQFAICGEERVLIHSDQRNRLSRAVYSIMTEIYIRICYEEIRLQMKVSLDNGMRALKEVSGIGIRTFSFAATLWEKDDDAEEYCIGGPSYPPLF